MKNRKRAALTVLFVALVFFLVPHLSRAAQLQLSGRNQTGRQVGMLEENDGESSAAESVVGIIERSEADSELPASAPAPVPLSPEHSWYELVDMFPGTFFLKGSGNIKTIAITFDDGPDEMYTPQVLDVLRDYNVPATFFLIGQRSQLYPGVVERIMAEGHVVANHSWSHPRLPEVSAQEVRREMQLTEDMLAEITGLRTALMRPPYGAISKEVLTELQALDYKVINWTADSVDWRDQTVEQIMANTLPDVKNGGILLFHSAGGAQQSRAATVEALPLLIETLRAEGYRFVTVDELLGVAAYRSE